MTKEKLKLVLLFDPKSGGYSRSAHNLAAIQADQEFGNVANVKIVDQGRHHQTADALKCRTCQSAALQATREQGKSLRAMEPGAGPAPAAADRDEPSATSHNS